MCNKLASSVMVRAAWYALNVADLRVTVPGGSLVISLYYSLLLSLLPHRITPFQFLWPLSSKLRAYTLFKFHFVTARH